MENDEQIKKLVFRSKDWEISSLLYATNRTLCESEWVNGVCYFVFDDRTSCEELISEFYKGEIVIDARDLFDGIRTIKNILRGKH